jgi:hypothetical protein
MQNLKDQSQLGESKMLLNMRVKRQILIQKPQRIGFAFFATLLLESGVNFSGHLVSIELNSMV